MSTVRFVVLLAGAVLAATGIFIDRPAAAQDALGCAIKGNISRRTGERIYHVPGQQYYDETKIDEGAGERWFCSEDEARSAGWRRSKV